MELQPMCPAGNSKYTQLMEDISASANIIKVADVSVFPAAPNYAAIGTENDAEVVFYTGVNAASNQLTGVTRGASNTIAKSWQTGIDVYHTWASDMYNTLRSNITTLAGALENIPDNPWWVANND